MGKKASLEFKFREKQKELRNRLKYEHIVTEISFSAITCLDIHSFINSALEKISKTTPVSRIYIFEYDHDNNTQTCTHEWKKEKLQPIVGRVLQAVSMPWFMSKMLKNQSIHTIDVEKNANDREKEVLQEHSMNSLLVIPMNISTEFYGFLGLASEKKGQVWDKNDEQLVQTIVHIISITIERKRMEGLVKLRIIEKNKLEKATRELEVAKEQLLRTAKLAELGELGASIIHELNTPLLAVKGFAQLALEQSDQSEGSREYLKKITLASTQMEKVIKNVRSFARVRKTTLEETNINEIIEKALVLSIDHLMLENISVKREFAENLPKILVDQVQIQQVMLNLIMNAKNALRDKEGGFLIIRSEFVKTEREVRVSFFDNGIGIAPDKLNVIFNPFYSGWEKGEGLGLGLAVSSQIIEENKGRIKVSSELKKGTTFTICFSVYNG